MEEYGGFYGTERGKREQYLQYERKARKNSILKNDDKIDRDRGGGLHPELFPALFNRFNCRKLLSGQELDACSASC